MGFAVLEVRCDGCEEWIRWFTNHPDEIPFPYACDHCLNGLRVNARSTPAQDVEKPPARHVSNPKRAKPTAGQLSL